MKKILVSLAYKILTYYKIKFYILPESHPLFEQNVLDMVKQVESKFKEQSGEFKRHQVLRAIKNIHPEAKERDIGYYIEMAVRKLG